jgi:hypothetical protein
LFFFFDRLFLLGTGSTKSRFPKSNNFKICSSKFGLDKCIYSYLFKEIFVPEYGWVKTLNRGLALAFLLTPVFVWRWTHTPGRWIISSMTSILKIVLWMFQKMFICYSFLFIDMNILQSKIISNTFFLMWWNWFRIIGRRWIWNYW